MADYHKPEAKTVNELRDIAHKLRIHAIQSTDASNSGHPTSCASMAELMACLFFNEMHYKVSEPKDPASDRFILSKGHAAPILYAAWAEAGLFPTSDLLNLRKIDSDLEGHPTPRLNFVDVATGSLGQGVSVAAGMAYVGKNIDQTNFRVYCLVGDGESAEGSVWEALHFGSHYNLDNLVVIFDINRLGQSEPTSLQHDMEVYRKRLEGFGYNTLVIDGHDCEEICKAYHNARQTKGRPTAILARTFKGKFFPLIEDVENWHGKPLGKDSAKVVEHLKGLIKNQSKHQLSVPKPSTHLEPVDLTNLRMLKRPNYKLGEMVATRVAYGNGIEKLALACSRVIALDGDTKNSTYSDKVLKVLPEQYIECYIAEQNLVGVAIGITCRDRTVAFASTFAAFFTRAFDQLRMGAISQTNINCVGSHAGISIGEDGPSQMALEDLALFRSIPGSTVFYPSDAVSCENAVELAANTKGICFIRTSRPNTAVIYANDHVFQIGKANVVKKSDNDVALIIGAGITLHEGLKAANILASQGVHIRVLDPFTIKPIDTATIIENAKACGGKIITVEDHYPEGGLGEAVQSAVALERNIVVKKLAVNGVPRSGPSNVLLQMFGIDSGAIVKAVESMSRV